MKILVIRFSALGDLVTLDITFRALRYFFKNAQIDFFTTGIGKGLYEDSEYFDNYIVKSSNFFKDIVRLREEKYDLVINLQCNKPSHYYNLFIKKQKTINSSYTLFQKILGMMVKPKYYKDIIESCDVNIDQYNNYFSLPESSLISLPIKETKNFLESNKKIIAISIGSSERWLSKKWGLENYSFLITKLLDKNFDVVLVGSKLEESESKVIESKQNKKIFNFVNKTSLSDLKNILNEADLFIGNDSGPAHIAAGVGTNTITIFGPTGSNHAPSNLLNNGKHFTIEPKDIDCAPCYKGKCPTKHECMKSIEVNEVFEKALAILN